MRYAIYFMPEEKSALWEAGSSILGYDAVCGKDRPFPAHPALAGRPLADWTAEPRRYGFHATLKAPFALRDGATEAGLLAAAREFASRQMAFTLPSLKVAALGRFIALIPADDSEPLQALADACVVDFDPFRAPMTAADRALRLAQPLGERLAAQLDRWGYPYVFDDFTFHMTLSGPLEAEHRALFLAALRDIYARIAAPLRIDAVAVFQQADADARFTVLERCAFGR